jgi:hypothetical protein
LNIRYIPSFLEETMSVTVNTLTGMPVTLDDPTIAAFQTAFYGPIILPGDAGYDEVRALWSGMHDRKPAFIARCTGDELHLLVSAGRG